MKTIVMMAAAVLFCVRPVGAVTMADLFASLKKNPVTELDVLQTQTADLSVQSAHDRFYPSLVGVLAYEEYNSPTNLRPVTPTEAGERAAAGEPFPFSDTIRRIGVRLSLPVFVKELFSLSQQAAILAESSRIKKHLNLLEREAVLVTADAHLVHMSSLKKALASRKASLEKTRDDVLLKVENGRASEVDAVRMDEAVNRIDIALNQTYQRESELSKTIESLTGIVLDGPAPLSLNGSLTSGELLALKPIEKTIEAGRYGVQAAKDKLYPRIVGTANWFHNYGEGYNNGEDIDLEYGNYALTLQMPLFNKPAYTDIEKANVGLHRAKTRFARTKIELQARARSLGKTLGLLGQSKGLEQKSVEHERTLLNVAKIAYAGGRMDQEEYLRYEEKVLSAEADYYLTEARWWETFSTLAVLYGNNLDGLIQ